MNFLAHAFLSGNDEKLVVGNFIADFVKGKSALQVFEGRIKEGILLHRSIDAFTDSHPVVSESKNRLRAKYRHYAGVIVDVFYDHFLCRNWDTFHSLTLASFAEQVYQIIENHFEIVPHGVQNFFPYMKRGNWLVNYGTTEGIARALSGMSRRTPYESKMDEAVYELVKFNDDFESEFLLFFPQLQKHVTQYLDVQNRISVS